MFAIVFYSNWICWSEYITVSGCEAAWEAYTVACKLAELAGKSCSLVVMETGEILASYDFEE